MKQIANNIRKNILHIANLAGSPHIGSALSCTDILTTLYFDQNDGTLPAHTDKDTNPYIEISAGSLGHGLPIATGMAHALKLKNSDREVYVLMGDGESQEGSVWEAAMLAPHLKLNNLTVFIDRNNLQGYGRASDILSYEPIDDKFRAFNWEVLRVDGHNHKAIKEAVDFKTDKPKMIICDTTKGKDVTFMEDELIWHYYVVTDEIKEKALCCLEEKSNEK